MKVNRQPTPQHSPMEHLELELMLQVNENLYTKGHITSAMYDHAKMMLINQSNTPREVHSSLGASYGQRRMVAHGLT